MKKLILVFVAVAITAGAYAQPDSLNRKMNLQDNRQYQNVQNNPVDKSLADGYVMQNGKIMQVKNGQTTLLERDITMSNGTKITGDGTCIKKDGSKMKFKEGQHMDMSGNMGPLKTNKDKNMYLVPDTTRRKGNN